jgi:catechol 2,3-dioxygenase-like lactoylglutathione lyase family enzyme
MQQLIEKMVTDFERGKLSRRQLAAALAGLVAVSANAAPSAPDLKVVGVNHVTLRVPDVERSTKFYQDVFGMTMRKASPTVKILGLNPNCFFGIEAANGKGAAVDHFALGIPNFKPKEAGAKLEKLGLKPDVAKDGLKFLDPDGILVQLNAPDYPGYLPGQQKP